MIVGEKIGEKGTTPFALDSSHSFAEERLVGRNSHVSYLVSDCIPTCSPFRLSLWNTTSNFLVKKYVARSGPRRRIVVKNDICRCYIAIADETKQAHKTIKYPVSFLTSCCSVCSQWAA